MQMQRSNSWLSFGVLIGLFIVGSVSNAECASLISAPRLNATAQSTGKAKLSWSIVPKFAGARNSLELQRKKKGEASFITFAKFYSPCPRRSILDFPGVDSIFLYRARLVTPHGRSAWTKAQEVELKVPTPDAPVETPLQAGQSLCPNGTIDRVIQLVNQERAKVSSPALLPHVLLNWSAITHDIYMAASGNLSHDGWSDYIRQSGFKYGRIGENIAAGQISADEVMTTWMNSDGHRSNILDSKFTYIGVGCIIDISGRYWWVQNFGSWSTCPNA